MRGVLIASSAAPDLGTADEVRPATAAGATAGFDPGLPWRLHPQVALRPERFGALAYHFGTRRLSFLKDPQLREVVETLAAHETAAAAMSAAGVPATRERAVVAALATLATSHMIERR